MTDTWNLLDVSIVLFPLTVFILVVHLVGSSLDTWVFLTAVVGRAQGLGLCLLPFTNGHLCSGLTAGAQAVCSLSPHLALRWISIPVKVPVRFSLETAAEG